MAPDWEDCSRFRPIRQRKAPCLVWVPARRSAAG